MTHHEALALTEKGLINAAGPAVISTAGPATYTPAQLFTGFILRDPNGLARSDVTPTAAAIIAALGVRNDKLVGSTFDFVIKNTADAAETITVTAGTSVTLVGTMTIAQGATRWFRARVTSTTAVSLYSIGGLTA